MAASVISSPLTTADLLAMPDNGSEHWLIRGELREKPMTVRNRFHSNIMASVTKVIGYWLDQQPQPRGQLLCGEAGVRLERDPDTTVGVDVVYISAATVQQQSEETTLVEGVPVLVVEILSPSDTQEEIDEKIDVYLRAGVALVWIIDGHDQTVLVYRPGAPPQLFTIDQELTAEPHLPGFRTPVRAFFA